MAACRKRVDRLVSRLTAAGFAPRVRHRRNRVYVEARVPDPVTAEAWRELLEALETADSFGLVDGAGDRTAWAAIDKETPATASTARGHGHQL